MIKLYGFPGAPTTHMVSLCLAEKGHAAELVVVDLPKGEQKQPAHLERHPFGLTPCLEDERGRLYECRAIIRYLDRALSGPALSPEDARAYALMEQFISVEREYFSPKVMPVYYKKLLGIDPGEEALAQARADAGAALDVAERALEGAPFLTGETISLADIAWTPYLAIAAWPETIELIESRPKVAAWWQRLAARPSWQAITPWGR